MHAELIEVIADNLADECIERSEDKAQPEDRLVFATSRDTYTLVVAGQGTRDEIRATLINGGVFLGWLSESMGAHWYVENDSFWPTGSDMDRLLHLAEAEFNLDHWTRAVAALQTAPEKAEAAGQ